MPTSKICDKAALLSTSYSAPELEHAYTRALALCRELGDTAQLFPALQGLSTVYGVRGDLQTGRELAEELLQLAEDAASQEFLMQAHFALGYALLWLGEVREGRTHSEHALRLYDPRQYTSFRFQTGFSYGTGSAVQAAYAAWMLGYPAQALQAVQEALTLAQEASYPLNIAMALVYMAGHHLHCRDYAHAREHAEAALTLSTEHGFAWWTTLATIIRGSALVGQGQPAEGLVQIQHGLESYRTSGAAVWKSHNLALLADAYGSVGHADEGLNALAEAFATVTRTQERWYEAELCRLRGELLLQQSPAQHADASACFQQALDVARHQQAKSWELRAATSLARLWQSQGKRVEAYDLLAPVYEWFTEGFDTADLKDAKALLEELG